MAHKPRTIHVSPETELASVLAAAVSTPVRLEKDGIIYRVVREDQDVWADYEPDAVHDALRTYAGTLSPEEGEALTEYIYRAREEGTRPATRP